MINRRTLRRRAGLVLLLAFLLPLESALARSATLAVVNLGPAGSHEPAEQAVQALGPLVGAWPKQPGVEGFLANRPNPGSLPAGPTGQEMVRLVERMRTERGASTTELADLGRLLGVDYLLLLRPRGPRFEARLFSVGRGYAPQTLEAPVAEVARVKDYVREQTTQAPPAKKSTVRWWVWAVAGALVALTIGLALSGSQDETKGDLTIRVTR